MFIEQFITYFARKKNADYLRFIPNAALDIPPAGKAVPTLLYMHVPFCEELCPYCSFNRVVFKEDLARAYYHALRREILHYKKLGYDFQALYVGGGTPTVLIDELEQTVQLIREHYNISEISVETNPNHLTGHNIERLKNMGVNRLSVGVQTFDDGILKALERYHKYGSGQEIADRLKQTQGSFDTLNADMIFNFPTQTMKILENDLSVLIELGIDQITYYPLMVSTYTHDIMRKKLGVVDYTRGNKLYFKITEMLSAHYRTSTAWCFSRKDRTMQAPIDSLTSPVKTGREGEAHTALPGEGATQAPIIDEYVVNFEEYAGLGSGSIGYLSGSAYANTFDLQTYIDEVNRGMLPLAGKKEFSKKERLRYDFLMKLFGLSLDLEDISSKHGLNAYRYLWPEIFFFRLVGGLKKESRTLRLTQKGQYYWVLMMREFFIGVNNFRDFCREEMQMKNQIFKEIE